MRRARPPLGLRAARDRARLPPPSPLSLPPFPPYIVRTHGPLPPAPRATQCDLLPLKLAKGAGFGTTLYLDATEQKYIEEFSVSNFIGVKHDGARLAPHLANNACACICSETRRRCLQPGTYVTPASESILESITNKMLMQLASARGMNVERRAVSYDELPSFSEVRHSRRAREGVNPSCTGLRSAPLASPATLPLIHPAACGAPSDWRMRHGSGARTDRIHHRRERNARIRKI